MDDRLSIKYAASFSKSTGVEFDDLLQEARIAYWIAGSDRGRYDPCKSAFVTFATWCVYRRLCSVTGEHKRKHPQHEELHEWSALDGSPDPEDAAMFREVLCDLPEDARLLVDLVLSDAQTFATITPAGARSLLRRTLHWPSDRANAAFQAVVLMLREVSSA